jgi:hypothetical protein
VQEVNPLWVAAVGSFAGVLAGIVVWIGRRFWRAFKRYDQFMEDWNGVDGDPGHPGRPGVMQRLVQLEHSMMDVQSQVHLNSGHSLRDEVQRTEAAVTGLTGKVDTLQSSVDELKNR